MRRTRWLSTVLASGVALAGCSSSSPTAGPSPTVSPTASPSVSPTASPSVLPSAAAVAAGPATWSGYHATQARTGAIADIPSLDPATPAWSTALGAAVYGQPLVGLGRIYAATENNRVVALDASTGKVLWSHTIGTPLTNVTQVAGCGDVDPLGVTSTPALDVAKGILYVVGEVSSGGAVHHQLQGFDVHTGTLLVSEAVDPPLPSGETATVLLQRASLAIANDRVYIGYGGNDGDCGHYHGWLVSVAERGAPSLRSFEVASDGEGGAIWEAGGAPALDAKGNLFVTTGNANPDPPQGGPDPKAYTESVVKLSPLLRPLASFKDKIAGGDEDLATGNPVLLPGGLVFSVGKTDVGYVLRQSDLSQVATISGICGSDPDGGPAYDATTNRLFVPCKDGGIQVLDLTTRKAGARLSGANGAPIIVGRHLWAAQYRDGGLQEYDVSTGAKQQHLATSPVPTFASPSAGLGLILIGTKTGVSSFR